MISSLFYAVLLLAAGSSASPCKPSNVTTGNSTGSTGTTAPKAAAQVAGRPGSVVLDLPLPDSNSFPTNGTSANAPTSSLIAPASASTSSPPNTSPSITPGNGKCPPKFLNTVFNTNAPQNPGFPSATWNTLTKHGINDWIGFSLGPLSEKPTYGLSASQASTMGPLNGAQIHVVMDPRDTESAKDMMKNSPPAYLELFNEPDYAFPVDGIPVTPITDAVTAATNLKPLIDMDHKNTQYISPALMNANDPNWLSAFFANCENCLDQINIFALHVYDPEVSGVMYQITQLHKKWPDKKIWITELSPASSGCALDADGIVKYINTLVPEILSTAPYVERIFWNSGESDSPALNGAPTACSPSLTNPDGSATKVLEALGAICQSGGDSTATA